jgi:predicted deacylase
MVPVMNILGFDRHSRYLPDRRDLNRCFPGSSSGSLASRMAKLLFSEIVGRCDYGIDLHTASIRRTNFPNVRADMSDPEVARLARAFGCEIILETKGPEGSLRREATNAGCPTFILEAGEPWKGEASIIRFAVRGVLSVLSELGMIDYEKRVPSQQLCISKTKWVRSNRGGFLRFHVGPGDVVSKGDALATNTSLTGIEQNTLRSPYDAIVVGMTTLPSTTPGDPVCHLGVLKDYDGDVKELRRRLAENEARGQLTVDLATNLTVVDLPTTGPAPDTDSTDVS